MAPIRTTAPITALPTLPSPDTLILEAGTDDGDAVLILHERRVEYDPLPIHNGIQPFRYIIYSPVSPRSRLRLSLVGEITNIREKTTVQGPVITFNVQCPSRATPNAHTYYNEVMRCIWNVAAAEHNTGAKIIANWVECGASDDLILNAICSPYAKIHHELHPNAIAIIDVTFHRYDHVGKLGTQREYNAIVHQIELLHPSFLQEQGYLPRPLSLLTVQDAIMRVAIVPAQTASIPMSSG
ncbi:hypothetical protein R3P38DRAFT_3201178 [Favolaschia claudopus]|uniref:Uncharacterized protein n=1 Tax=Favolaschia claudopus TaxID=2862362 RepID=A0AAW0AWJ1_9AGAR